MIIDFVAGMTFVFFIIIYVDKIFTHINFLNAVGKNQLSKQEIRVRSGSINYEDIVVSGKDGNELKRKLNKKISILRISVIIFLGVILFREFIKAILSASL